jgi:hypothetical protein
MKEDPMRPWLLGVVLVLALGAGPCGEAKTPPTADGAMEGEGVVHQGVGPECPAIWRITTDDGRMLWPVEDKAFQVEGLRVRFSARAKPDMASTCMAGTIVELLSIRKL